MKAEFDEVANDYDAQLNRGLSLSGENKEYFAEGRMKWLGKRLGELGFAPRQALDFGCGTGTATPWFFDVLGVEQLVGSDPSAESLKVASDAFSGRYPVSFCLPGEERPESVDLAFCNGVYHHILPADRPGALAQVYRALRPGGMFAFWENNPWNPGTRWAMSRVPFDADAIVIWPGEARRMLGTAGFTPLGSDFLFYFPRFLSAFRFLERGLVKLPLGGQYLVLARK
jgi:SAM-dependent methyltransferase